MGCVLSLSGRTYLSHGVGGVLHERKAKSKQKHSKALKAALESHVADAEKQSKKLAAAAKVFDDEERPSCLPLARTLQPANLGVGHVLRLV